MSNLVKHAESELRRAGPFGGVYGGELGRATLELVRLFSDQGHSGASAALTIELASRLMRFEPLTPLTDDPLEWMDIDGRGLLQSTRQPSAFSRNGGRTYHDHDEERRWLRRVLPWPVWRRLPVRVLYPMHRTVAAGGERA